MKKNIILIFFSILVGILLSKFVFSMYNQREVLSVSKKDISKYYFVQLGSFTTYDNMINNTTSLSEFIYMEEDYLYYVFGCITKNKNNLLKLEGYYKDNGYNTYIREFNLSNQTLSNQIDKLDLLLNDEKELDKIKDLCNQSIRIYKEG